MQHRREDRAKRGAEINARRRELQEQKPEFYRAQKAAWLAANPEKRTQARERHRKRRRVERNLDPVSDEYLELIRFDPCSYCGERIRVYWDHIEAEHAGGAHHWTNSTAACSRCNASKKHDLMLRFLLRRPSSWPQTKQAPSLAAVNGSSEEGPKGLPEGT